MPTGGRDSAAVADARLVARWTSGCGFCSPRPRPALAFLGVSMLGVRRLAAELLA
jgi:hypothetical protein